MPKRLQRGIAKITDNNDLGDILLACDLTSVTSSIGPSGTQIGSPIFSSDGMTPNGAGSVKFSGVDDGRLQWAGQIVVTVTTEDVSQYDNSASYVTGSDGTDNTAYVALWHTLDSVGASAGRCIVSNAEQLQARFDTLESDFGAYVHSANHGPTVEVCVWWSGTKAGIYVDGVPLKSIARADSFAQSNFTDIIVGAHGTGGNSNYFDGTIKNIVVSSMPPGLNHALYLNTVQFFGDSFAAHACEAISIPRCSATASSVMRGLFAQQGIDVVVQAQGNGGYTVCDTGANDLSGNYVSAAALKPSVVIIMAANNDVDATDVQIADVSTGTEANYKTFINAYGNNGQTYKCIITTAGSLYQDSTLNTAPKNARLATINAIIRALPAWWDAANPARAGFVEVLDLHTLFGGDKDTNLNYKGETDKAGNATIAPGTTVGSTCVPDGDRHPSYLGEIKIGRELYNILYPGWKLAP